MNVKQLQQMPPWQWPEEAGALLRELLADRGADPSDRLVAVELAGDYTVIDDNLVGALLSILRDGQESEALRAAAAISLGPVLEQADLMGFEDLDDILVSEKVFLELQKSLRTLFLDSDVPTLVRRRILEASVRAPMEWHPGAVRKAFASAEDDWRLTAVFCMGFIEGFDEEILGALKDDDPSIHYHAVRAAGNWELDDAWDYVLSLALSTQTERTLRLAAIDAVVGIRPEEASMALTDVMGDTDEEIVEAVFEALAMSSAIADLDDDVEEDNF